MKLSATQWMLLAVVCFSTMAITIKEIGQSINPFEITFFRSIVGISFLVIFFRKKLNPISFREIS